MTEYRAIVRRMVTMVRASWLHRANGDHVALAAHRANWQIERASIITSVGRERYWELMDIAHKFA